jgi:hypothetical protein
MTFSAFHYLTLSVRCEELDALICEHILEKMLSTFEVGPIFDLIAPSPFLLYNHVFDSSQKWLNILVQISYFPLLQYTINRS